MWHPKIVLIGPRASGKSTLVASISGVFLGTSSTCPVEWNMRRSDAQAWSAKVSVGYFSHKFFDSKKLRVHSSLPLGKEGGLCSSPAQLLCLLRKAEVIAFSPGQDIPAILSMDEVTIAHNYSNKLQSSSPSRGVIFVKLRAPVFSPSGITIVDLPGLMEAGYLNIINHTRSVARFYATQEGVRLAIVVRITDRKPKPLALSLIEEGKWSKGTTVILTHAEGNIPDTRWLKLLAATTEQPYSSLCFRLPELRVAFALTESDIQRLRRDEAAHFLFSEPWSLLPHHATVNLGIVNILRHWELTWNLEKTKRKDRPQHTVNWKGVCIGLLILLVFLLSTLLIPLSVSLW